jgi:integrase
VPAKATTKAVYATLARTHIIASELGRHTLDNVKPPTMEAWILELREKGLAQSSVRQLCTVQ